MIPFPSTIAPLADHGRRVLRPWIQYFQQFTIAPPNIMTVTLTASPFDYDAREPGNVALIGGTITAVSLIRGSITLNMGAGTNKFIPVSIKDIVRITYTAVPSVRFIPAYGQNTG